MSTRCQIIIEGADVVLYRHSDGYPDGENGVIKALKPIVANFVKWRGFDECYMPAHIISEMIVAHKKWSDKMIRRVKKDETKDAASKKSYIASYESGKYLGYGVEAYNAWDDDALHGDIAFLYVVKKNGTIEVRQPEFHFGDENKPSNINATKLIKTVRYGKK